MFYLIEMLIYILLIPLFLFEDGATPRRTHAVRPTQDFE